MQDDMPQTGEAGDESSDNGGAGSEETETPAGDEQV